MENKVQIQLPFNSRHKRTPLYTAQGKTFFGLWEPPSIILDGDEKLITVSSDMAGQLDLLAYKEYEDSSLWWCIAFVNNIKNPTTEVVYGMELIIPKIENIRAALLDETQ